MSLTMRRTVLLLGLGGLADVAGADPARVEVFTDRAHPVTRIEAFAGSELRIYRIDGLVAAQNALSEGLPAEPEAALKIATARFEARSDALVEQMFDAGEGLARAFATLGLDRYPAIVFDGESVIYGVTDLAVAYRLYQESRR